jgi:hypothetical protein
MKYFVMLLCLIVLMGCANNPPPAAAPPDGQVREDIGPLYDRGTDFAPNIRRRVVILAYPLLEVGMSREEVRAKMGAPDLASPLYTKQPPATFRGWSYRYIVSESEVISLYFGPADDRLQMGVSHGIPGLNPIGGQPAGAR